MSSLISQELNEEVPRVCRRKQRRSMKGCQRILSFRISVGGIAQAGSHVRIALDLWGVLNFGQDVRVKISFISNSEGKTETKILPISELVRVKECIRKHVSRGLHALQSRDVSTCEDLSPKLRRKIAGIPPPVPSSTNRMLNSALWRCACVPIQF